MNQRDERLEAAAKAWAAGEWPMSWDSLPEVLRQKARRVVGPILAASGGFDESKRSKLTGNLAHLGGCYHCKNGKEDCNCPGIHGTKLALPVAADPPWYATIAEEIRSQFNSGGLSWKSLTPIQQEKWLWIVRAVLAFAAAQPPSEAWKDRFEWMINSFFSSFSPGLFNSPDPSGRLCSKEQFIALIDEDIAATKARTTP
jgi:hypothetical protein